MEVGRVYQCILQHVFNVVGWFQHSWIENQTAIPIWKNNINRGEWHFEVTEVLKLHFMKPWETQVGLKEPWQLYRLTFCRNQLN